MDNLNLRSGQSIQLMIRVRWWWFFERIGYITIHRQSARRYQISLRVGKSYVEPVTIATTNNTATWLASALIRKYSIDGKTGEKL